MTCIHSVFSASWFRFPTSLPEDWHCLRPTPFHTNFCLRKPGAGTACALPTRGSPRPPPPTSTLRPSQAPGRLTARLPRHTPCSACAQPRSLGRLSARQVRLSQRAGGLRAGSGRAASGLATAGRAGGVAEDIGSWPLAGRGHRRTGGRGRALSPALDNSTGGRRGRQAGRGRNRAGFEETPSSPENGGWTVATKQK